MSSQMKGLLNPSWRTSIGGIIMGVGLIWSQVELAWDDDPKTEPNISIIVAAIGSIWTGLTARDNQVTSEKANITHGGSFGPRFGWLLMASGAGAFLAGSLLAQDDAAKKKPPERKMTVPFSIDDERTPPKAKDDRGSQNMGKLAVAGAGRKRELTLRQRRELGLTIPNIARIAKEMKAEGEIEAEMSNAEMAAVIANRLYTENPRAFANEASIDLEAIIAFIENIMPLIQMLIDLFTSNTPTVYQPLVDFVADVQQCLAA